MISEWCVMRPEQRLDSAKQNALMARQDGTSYWVSGSIV